MQSVDTFKVALVCLISVQDIHGDDEIEGSGRESE